MKELKRFLMWLYVAVLTSSWWAAANWGYGSINGLWALPIFLTLFFIAGYGAYLFDVWNND